MAVRTVMTAEDLARLPDDGFRYELVRGELVRMAPAGGEHGEVCSLIVAELVQHVRARGLGRVYDGQTGFVLQRNPDTVRVPDAAVVLKQRLPVSPRGFIEGAPDLVVEVLSPADGYGEVLEKVHMWLRSGCRSVWLVDPTTRTVALWTAPTHVRYFAIEDTITGDPVLPEFELPVARLFPGPVSS